MIVLDASAVVEWLLQSVIGAKVEARVLAEATAPQVPHLLDIEVTQSFRKLLAAKLISTQRAQEAFDHFMYISIERHSHQALLSRVWGLRGHLTAYDAVYVALAEALDAPLLTCDRRLASTPGHSARIELIRA